MHAASTSYWAEIAPDSTLRRVVLCAGAVLLLAGLAFLPQLAVSPLLKGALGIAWFGLCCYEWLALWRGYAATVALRIAAGGHVECRRPDGSWAPAALCAGSVVLPGIAWLRVAPGDGPRYAELVCARRQGTQEWRRLQVIWRHIGAA